MRTISLAAIMTSLCVCTTSAQAENLLQVYQAAKGYDSQLKAQETNYLATLENKPLALANKKPQVTLSGTASETFNYTFFDASPLSDTSSNTNFNANYTLNVNKSLYNKKLDRQIDQTDASIAQAKAGLEEQRQNLIIRVAQRYFNFLLAQDTVEFTNAEQQNTKRQLDQVKAFFNAGRSAITDVHEAQARYDAVLAQVINANQQLQVAREALRVVTGVNYQTLNAPQENMTLAMPKPSSLPAWINTAKQNNKSLKTQQLAVEAARASIDVQRADKNPTVDLYARHTGSLTEGDSALDQRNMGLSVGVQASIPLYTGGAAAARVRQAQHQFRAAQQNYTYQLNTVEEQVRSAYLTVQSTIAQANANRQALVSAQTASQAAQLGFQVGTRTAIDTLTALRNVYSARRDLASSRYTYLLNILNLQLAAGTLSETNLQQMSRYLTQPPSLQRAALQQQIQRQEAARRKILDSINDNTVSNVNIRNTNNISNTVIDPVKPPSLIATSSISTPTLPPRSPSRILSLDQSAPSRTVFNDLIRFRF